MVTLSLLNFVIKTSVLLIKPIVVVLFTKSLVWISTTAFGEDKKELGFISNNMK